MPLGELAMIELLEGDCADILPTLDRKYHLVYLDPPFNSQREYYTTDGELAFSDVFDERWYEYSALEDQKLKNAIITMTVHSLRLRGYLTFMAYRLVRIKAVLDPLGSVWVHVDPATSHYLKVVMDLIFGPPLRNEIVWCYAPSGRAPNRGFHRKHDVILYYAPHPRGYFKPQFTPMTERTRKAYNKTDHDGRAYQERWIDGKPHRSYLDEQQGRPIPDWWTDIPSFASASNSPERCGYPTQKPQALIERILRAGTDIGHRVLDPFMGSGTTAVVARDMGRHFTGIDNSKVAIRVAYGRLA